MRLPLLDIAALSRLLDEVLELDGAARDAWFNRLPAAERHLETALRDMLAERDRTRHASFLSDLPQTGGHGADRTTAQAGDIVGPYRLVHELGRGGMGSVWLADRADGTFKRQVALKLPLLSWDHGLAERMAREREVGALLEHPHIARLYDAGLDRQGRPYLAFEYIDGLAIDAWCAEHSSPVHERLKLVVQVARAVAYAHGRLVVHRDIKPSNVMVTGDGVVHLLDFGIAKLLQEAGTDASGLTKEQERVLTLHFASPEQVRGDTITVQSDVYSLGVLAYELLAGTTPYRLERKSLGAMEMAVMAGDPPLASERTTDPTRARQLRGELDSILARALKCAPGERYPSADALADDIQRHLDGERVLARPDTLGYRIGKTLRRYRGAFIAAAVAGMALVAGAGVALIQAERAREQAVRAEAVKGFMVDLFRVASRGQANRDLRQLPVEMLLERGARSIQTRFAQEPQLKAELYGLFGGIFSDLGSREFASTYAAKQVQELESNRAPAAARVRAHLLLAEALQAERRMTEARASADRALALASGDAELDAAAKVLMVRVLRWQGQPKQAQEMLDQAEQAVRRLPSPSVLSARVKLHRAAFLSNGNRRNEALPMYQSAIDEALAVEGSLSPTAIEFRLILARDMVSWGRGVEALVPQQAALAALRESGGIADVTAALEESGFTARAHSMDQMEGAHAVQVIRHAREQLASYGTLIPESMKASVDFDLGKVLAVWGNVKEADPLIARQAALLASRGEGPSVMFYLASYRGLVAMLAGRNEEAARMFELRIDNRRKLGTANHPFAISDFGDAAYNEIIQGHHARAEQLLALADQVDAGGRSAPETAAYFDIVPRMRALSRLLQGDAAAALALLPPESRDEEGTFPNNDVALRGEILCAAGRPREGLARLDKALRGMQSKQHPLHPELARVRAVAGLCALKAGAPERAPALLAQARDALSQQASVCPFFATPAAALETSLARAQRTTDSGRAMPAGRRAATRS